ncbi:glycosyltransferase [Patescibacteria group bacterium]|nr:glycosyltransferase [Patescibacteria group bacterium]MBU0922950.1 glycosyltransferase [Patescibacteria group bacterium]MBU1844571.1 glycosyltransferase [Patescibacteria group bacterium]
MKPFRFLILTKNIDGGTGTFAVNLLKIEKLFKKPELETKIVVLEKPKYRYINKDDKGKFIFLRKAGFYPHKYIVFSKIPTHFWQELIWVKKLIKNYNPDLIFGIDVHANLLIQINKFFFFQSTKTLLTTHIDLGKTIAAKSSFLANFLLRKIIGFLYNRADALVCVSKSLGQDLSKTFRIKKRVSVVYNGYSNLENRQMVPKKLSKKTFTIITVARLVEQKDHQTLIKAFKLVQEKLPNTKLLIASDGPLKHDLMKLVSRLGLSRKVSFLGWVKNINPYLKKSNIFVLSSKREGFGYVLVEAMQCGTPVVSTDTPYGPSEVLDNGKYGILVPMGNEEAMKKAILKLLTDKKTYHQYAKMASKRSAFFSLDKMLISYMKIIDGLLDA